MRLPDTDLWKAEIKVLSYIPSVVRVSEIEANHMAVVGIGKVCNFCICALESHVPVGKIAIMQQASPCETCTSINEPYNKGWDHVTIQLRPVSPASPDVEHGNNIMTLSEELVSCQPNAPRGTEGKDDGQEEHGNDAPDHVSLRDPSKPDFGLRLIQPELNHRPSDGMKSRLDEDDISKPAMKEVEALVRYPGDD